MSTRLIRDINNRRLNDSYNNEALERQQGEPSLKRRI